MVEPVLIIDLGTTSTSALLAVDKRTELVSETASGRLDWPSSVLADRGELIVGYVAEDLKSVRPASYQSEIKRLLSRNEPIDLDGQSYRPDKLITTILGAVHERAEAVYGGPVTHAVLTVPASYWEGDPRRDLTIRATEATGCTTVELLREPIAASLSEPAGAPFSPGDLVLVYDFGGGTFDVALVRIGKGDNEILASGGLEDCGGYDLDERIADYLSSRDEDVAKLFLEVERYGARLEVLDVARSLKHQLSTRQDSHKVLPSTGHEVSLSRADFEQIARELIERTIECCSSLVREAGSSPEDLNTILLVGGGSYIPLVSQMLYDTFDIRPRAARDPGLAVVRGAALWAGRGDSRAAMPVPDRADDESLRWDIPDGVGTMLDWRVEEGAAYPAGTVLARIRLPNGQMLRLTAAQGSVLRARHARPGDRVESGSWLATVQRTSQAWATSRLPVLGNFDAALSCAGGRLFLAVRHRCWAFDLATGAKLWETTAVGERSTVTAISVADGAVQLTHQNAHSTSQCSLRVTDGKKL